MVRKCEAARSNESGDQELLTSQALARRWNISPKKLEADRWRGTSPIPFLRIRAAVRYRLADVLAFEEASLIRSTSAPKSDGAVP